MLKINFPFGIIVSIAAPASYWYLKASLITEMAESLDYIVYMTFDQHGITPLPRRSIYTTKLLMTHAVLRLMGLRETV
jgi:hypothetical protein